MELRLTVPTSYQDLSDKQLDFISSLFVLGLPETDFLVRVFIFLSGLKVCTGMKNPDQSTWFKHPSIDHPFLVDDEQMVAFTDGCRWLISIDECTPPKWLKANRSRHPRLYNATFDEYLMAENYFFAFQTTNDPVHLDCLIASLYRYPWSKWDSNLIKKRSKRFSNLSPEIKNRVLIWYLGFRVYVSRRCKTLFTPEGSGTKETFNARRYINGLVHQLSNGDVTIKNRILTAKAMDALDELEQRAIEVKNLKK
jgi:hypothetical protein